jgi:hypothetical protein
VAGLRGLISAVVAELRARELATNAGPRRPDTMGQPSAGQPSAGRPTAVAAVPPPAAAVLPQAAAPRPAPPDSAATPESTLVRQLFANPRSLVAAFIVAEVLAKPVTLRDR